MKAMQGELGNGLAVFASQNTALIDPAIRLAAPPPVGPRFSQCKPACFEERPAAT
jgi:hypothetical protein